MREEYDIENLNPRKNLIRSVESSDHLCQYTSYPNRCNKNMIGKTTENTVNSQDLIENRRTETNY